jgi:hypothetical protein
MRSMLFAAVALLASGCGLKSGSTTTTTTGGVPPPSAPAADRKVELGWNASTGTVQGYKVEASGDGVNFVELGYVDGSATGVRITGLYSSTKYYFRVRAFNQGANSDYGAVVPISL